MKVYIVFSGIVTVLLMAMCFQGDMRIYEHEQWLLKELTEEVACGAALYVEQEAYAEGNIVFDYEKGKSYAKDYLKQAKRNSYILNNGIATIELEFEDDKVGYSKDNTYKMPTVTAKFRAQHNDIFRLPFLSVKQTFRESRYELKEV
ncbi:MAG: hypothetical protein HXK71_02485 [Clostridiales bacterium]|nr:hypothetical protein [Clostridiales bacterium]